MALIISPLAAAAGVFGVEVLVRGFLPAFDPGLPAVKIFMLTVFFVHTTSITTQVLVAFRRVRLLIGLTVAALVAEAALLGIASLSGLTLTAASQTIADVQDWLRAHPITPALPPERERELIAQARHSQA